MEIRFSLSLPRDAISIPVVRRMCAQSLKVLGVSQDCIDDVELALTEACDNVLKHARSRQRNKSWYEVSVGVDMRMATIEVIDNGGGFDLFQIDNMILDTPIDDPARETGRGIYVMRAIMDNVRFEVVHDGQQYPGTRVHLEKVLRWDENAPANRLGRDIAAVGCKTATGHPVDRR